MSNLIDTWLDVCSTVYGFDQPEAIEYLNERLGNQVSYDQRNLNKWKRGQDNRVPSLEAYYVMIGDVLRARLSGVEGFNVDTVIKELELPGLLARLPQD